jgi:hypothetical protein
VEEPAATSAGEPRFVVDAMLGRLARWLRLLGHDVLYDPRRDDREIARIAAREDRVVLTRDHGLLARRLVRRGLLLSSDHVPDQLRQVVAALTLTVDRARIFTRCIACNAAVAAVDKASIEGRVPPYVFRSHERFARCPGCGRIYWGGSHERLALRRLEQMLAERPADGDPESA